MSSLIILPEGGRHLEDRQNAAQQDYELQNVLIADKEDPLQALYRVAPGEFCVLARERDSVTYFGSPEVGDFGIIGAAPGGESSVEIRKLVHSLSISRLVAPREFFIRAVKEARSIKSSRLRHRDRIAGLGTFLWLRASELTTRFSSTTSQAEFRPCEGEFFGAFLENYARNNRALSYVPEPEFFLVRDDFFSAGLVEASWWRAQGQEKSILDTLKVTPKRTCATQFGARRPLPFLIDLIDAGMQNLLDEDVLIVTNADTGVVRNGMQRIREAFKQRGLDAGFCFRRNFSALKTIPVSTSRGVRDGGADLFAIRKSWWKKVRHVCPDMVLGCEGWDFVMRQLMAETQLGKEVELPDVIWHIRHAPEWKKGRYNTPEQNYNRALAYNFISARKETEKTGAAKGFPTPVQTPARPAADFCVVIPACPKDQEQVLRLIQWIGTLNGGEKHQTPFCLLTNGVGREMRTRLNKELEYITHQPENVHIEEFVEGWPRGCNTIFREALQHFAGASDFLWLEGDAIPTKRRWLQEIQNAWTTRQPFQHFMGNLVEYHWNHMTGVAVYGADSLKHAPKLAQADNMAWDVFASDQVLKFFKPTKLIQHVFFNPEISLSLLDPEAVIFHQDKQGKLIELLKKFL